MAKKKTGKAKKSKKTVKKAKKAKKAAARTVKKKAARTSKKKVAKKAKKSTKKVAKKVAKKTAKKAAKKTATKKAKKTATKSTSAPSRPLPAIGTQIKDYELPVTMGVASLAAGPEGGERKKLSELAGPAGLVLYFYPKDSTPGCTVEACEFRDNLARLKSTGYNPVGVSADPIKAHRRFTEKQSLNFPLIADEEKTMLGELGLWVEKKLYGRAFMGIPRTTFVLDADLKLRSIYEKVKPKGHAEQIMTDLAAL